jgi:YesN/AraC family two-component response regulator
MKYLPMLSFNHGLFELYTNITSQIVDKNVDCFVRETVVYIDMDPNDKLYKAGLAINRLHLNSARMVYCKHFDENNIPFNIKEAPVSNVSGSAGENQCSMWNLSKHSHDFLELIYFIDGQANIKGKRAEYMVSPFNIVLYPEGIVHQELLSLYKHQEIICIGVKFSKKSNLETILSLKDQNNRLKWIFTEIHKQHCIEEKRNVDIVYSLVKLMFFYIQQFLDKGADSSTNRVEQAICYIRENFNSPITIEELAHFVNVSPTFLNKLFKKATGTTPISYVNLVRIEIAKQMLLAPDASVSIVCEKVGIDDPKYFSRLFKKVELMTPSEYIGNNLQTLSPIR